jgi:di/tripeptidase
MTQIIKAAVKQDLDKYVDIVDSAMEALNLLTQESVLQEQIDGGFGADEDDAQLAKIKSDLMSWRSQWNTQIQACGHTNNRGSIAIPLSSTLHLDIKNVNALEQEILAAKAEVSALEIQYGIEAKNFR